MMLCTYRILGLSDDLNLSAPGIYKPLLGSWHTTQHWRRGTICLTRTNSVLLPEKGTSWSLYIEKLNFHFEAHGITDDAKKRAVLLGVWGSSTYSLIRSVISPKPPNELSYEEITVAMRQYFNPAPSEIVERFRFYKRDQRPNESIADFVAELRRLSEHCNFGNGLDTALRDRFVCGIADEGLQRRLLAEQVPTFDVALREALATETARLQALEIRTGGCTEDVQHVRMKSRQQKSTDKATGSRQRTEFSAKCYRCGGAHDAQACRFINERCRYCQRMGHIERLRTFFSWTLNCLAAAQLLVAWAAAMMLCTYRILGLSDDLNLSAPGIYKPGTSWSLYIEKLNFHFEAHGITDDAKKRAVLLGVWGSSTYSLIRSVISPKPPNELSYEEITVAMRQYFNPAPSEIVERFRFYKRDQRPNESIADFVAKLR
ncbi:hypothetical protein M514_23457 [Trichuris suis]|uniref:Retrotransposon gag domain-containing protein n=1 Tax=Trichuris suis TaxID=68888 RepID=A0A085N4N7_9BILA|nr:hypothetical protein M514_23457 [Trichuris suis]